MAEWIYFIHPPRDNFAETMTDEEAAVWAIHFERFKRLLAEGVIVLVGPTLGPINTGIAIFEAPDEGRGAAVDERGPGDRRRLRQGRAATAPDLTAAGQGRRHP